MLSVLQSSDDLKSILKGNKFQPANPQWNAAMQAGLDNQLLNGLSLTGMNVTIWQDKAGNLAWKPFTYRRPKTEPGDFSLMKLLYMGDAYAPDELYEAAKLEAAQGMLKSGELRRPTNDCGIWGRSAGLPTRDFRQSKERTDKKQ